MTLLLERPLAFLDLESTGVSPERDRIVEIAILKVHEDGREELRCKRICPGMPIPPEATAIHGITDADVEHEPTFGQYAQGIDAFLHGCDLAGFGIMHFDLPLLRNELLRTRRIDFRWRERRVLDAMTIFHREHPRDLAAAVRLYCGHSFQAAHSAKEDVRAAMAVLLAQIDVHEQLPTTVDELHLILNAPHADWVDHDGRLVWIEGEAALGFGQHKGRLLRDLVATESDYLEWVLRMDFPPDTHAIIADALHGRYPTARHQGSHE
jgi:DNA polymerase-3 subunit epsilon